MPQPFAQSLLTFRGGTNGNEAPIRVVQGPATKLINYFDTIAVDAVHNETFVVAGYPKDHVMVFDREANGNVAPIRVLQGPDTRIGSISLAGLAVDPVHNLLVVLGNTTAGVGGMLSFDRTAQGKRKTAAGDQWGCEWKALRVSAPERDHRDWK